MINRLRNKIIYSDTLRYFYLSKWPAMMHSFFWACVHGVIAGIVALVLFFAFVGSPGAESIFFILFGSVILSVSVFRDY